VSNRLLIVTDAWHPQTNGVVRCLESVGKEMSARGTEVEFLSPERFWTLPMPTYPEIQLALAMPGSVGAHIEHVRPDHIHIATEGPLGLQARLHCEWNGIGFTTSYHTRFPEYVAARVPIPHDVSYAYLRWFHEAAAATLVPTAGVAVELERQGFRNLRTWTRGVDGEHFRPGAKTKFHRLAPPHLLYVGRVSVEKNVKAFLELDVPGTKIVVGDGPQLPELARAFPDCLFLGRRTGAELVSLYQSADVFVFPSRTDTFGNVMLEALSCGVPVAAYPVTGPLDVLTDGYAGVLDEDLGVAVRKALTLSRHAARRHAQNFTWRRCADLFAAHLVPAQVPSPRAA